MAVVGAWAWAAAGGLDFEVEAGDFWDAVVFVGSTEVPSRMDTMTLHRINAL